MRTMGSEFSRRVAFVPRVAAQSGMGPAVLSDGEPIAERAKVLFGSGQERREAGQHAAQQTATFRVRTSRALRAANTTWEIDFSGARWGISSIVEIEPHGAELEFTAVKRD